MSERQPFSRGLMAAIVAGAAWLWTRRSAAASGRLLVFLHLPLKQRALQKLLGAALPGVQVTAVGRIADFDRALAAGQDAVLSLPVVLKARVLTPKLRGYRNGMTDETYSLVDTRSVPEPRSVKVVGALDILGRSGTTAFVRGMLGAAPTVQRVTKVEDLLALLQMRRAEVILLPTRLVSELKRMSRLNLVHRELGPRVGLPAASPVGPRAAQVIAAIDRLPPGTSRTLGVDEWR
jgi:hypothetical protein